MATLSREVGKTAGEAESEVFRGLDCIHAACSIGPEIAGMFLGSDPTLLQTFYEPLVGTMHAVPVQTLTIPRASALQLHPSVSHS